MEQQNMNAASVIEIAAAPANLKQLGIRACGTCVRAKAKCVPGTRGRKCQRCHRLQKDCEPPANARKRPKSTQVTRLEKRLDNLVSLLSLPNRGSRDDREEDEYPNPALALENRDDETLLTVQTMQKIVNSPLIETFTETTSASTGFSPSSSSYSSGYNFETLGGVWDVFLLIFRTKMAAQIPYVIIPSEWNSDELRRQKPVLWKAVMTAASFRSPARQEALGRISLEEISTRLLLKGEKSLDLLQGLLVHIAWYHYHMISNPQITTLLHLTKALVKSLGYFRTRTVRDRRHILLNEVDVIRDQPESELLPNPETLEESRAVAGCFIVTAMAVSGCRQVEPFQLTKQVEKSAIKLAEIQQYESDRYIVHLCRINNIAIKISRIYDDPEDGSSFDMPPTKMHIKVLEGELNTLKRTIPQDILENELLKSGLQIVEINLYEAGLYNTFFKTSDKIHRIGILNACLNSVKTFFDDDINQNSSVSASMSFGKWSQTGYALLMGVKLCLCVADGWVLGEVRETLNFPTYLDKLTRTLEGELSVPVYEQDPPRQPPEMLTRFLRQLRHIRAWYESSSTDGMHPQDDSHSTQGILNFDQHKLGTSFALSMDVLSQDDLLLNLDTDFWDKLYHDNGDWTMTDYGFGQ